jgi:hypothetical protein
MVSDYIEEELMMLDENSRQTVSSNISAAIDINDPIKVLN